MSIYAREARYRQIEFNSNSQKLRKGAIRNAERGMWNAERGVRNDSLAACRIAVRSGFWRHKTASVAKYATGPDRGQLIFLNGGGLPPTNPICRPLRGLQGDFGNGTVGQARPHCQRASPKKCGTRSVDGMMSLCFECALAHGDFVSYTWSEAECVESQRRKAPERVKHATSILQMCVSLRRVRGLAGRPALFSELL